MKKFISGLLLGFVLALGAYKVQAAGNVLTLSNQADYGNIQVAIGEAQGGDDAGVFIGTKELGVVNLQIPGKQ